MAYAWSPSLAEIGAQVPLRTRVVDGAYSTTDLDSGTFSSTTTPTDTQVLVLQTGVEAEIVNAAGTIPTALYSLAKWVSILGTAARIEATYPTVDGDNAATQLQADYERVLGELIAAAPAAGGGSAGTGVDPVWSYPPAVPTVGYPPVTTIHTRF